MLAFSACVLAGGAFTAALRYYAPSPVLHLAWLAFATTSILVGIHDAVHAPPRACLCACASSHVYGMHAQVGALELMPYGLNIYVMLGIILVWMVLVVGDVVTEREE